jgi:hypothetical protein
MGDSENESAEEEPIEPLDQNDYDLPDTDTQDLDEGVESGDLKKTNKYKNKRNVHDALLSATGFAVDGRSD